MAFQTVMVVHDERDRHNFFTAVRPQSRRESESLYPLMRTRPFRIVLIEHPVFTEEDQHIIGIYVDRA